MYEFLCESCKIMREKQALESKRFFSTLVRKKSMLVFDHDVVLKKLCIFGRESRYYL